MPAPRSQKREPTLVEHLAAQAIAKPVNNILGIDKYYTSATLLLRQAEDYRRQHNEPQQYVMLLRFASLIIETIPQHNSFKKSDTKYVTLVKSLRESAMPTLESLKLSLATRDENELVARSVNRPADAVQLSTSNLPGVNWVSPASGEAAGAGAAASYAAAAAASSGMAGYMQGVPAPEPMAPSAPPAPPAQLNVDDLLDIIQHGTGPSAPPPPSSSPPSALPGSGSTALTVSTVSTAPTYQPRYAASSSSHHAHSLYFSGTGGTYGSTGGTYASPAGGEGSGFRSSTVSSYPALPAVTAPGSVARAATLPRYPGLSQLPPLSQPAADPSQQLSQLALATLPQPAPSAGPSLGPQEIGVLSVVPGAPGTPHTCSMQHGAPPPPPPPGALSAQQQQQLVPAPPQPPQQEVQQVVGGPKELAKKAQLRDVHVSVALMEEFLAYAKRNTQRGIESCGILAGRLSANDSLFTITTLIIPKQQGTTDTVQALNEEEIFEVQFSQELYPLGWIHTHPTQTCFLSSVDVHTQCGYQTMLDEALAIVMAPTDRIKKCGIFRLSTPGGLTLVQRCGLRGFHAHPETSTGQELYELCGHVYLNPRAKHSVIDLR